MKIIRSFTINKDNQDFLGRVIQRENGDISGYVGIIKEDHPLFGISYLDNIQIPIDNDKTSIIFGGGSKEFKVETTCNLVDSYGDSVTVSSYFGRSPFDISYSGDDCPKEVKDSRYWWLGFSVWGEKVVDIKDVTDFCFELVDELDYFEQKYNQVKNNLNKSKENTSSPRQPRPQPRCHG